MANNLWGTPEKYIISARKVMIWIDLDPASSYEANKIVQASQYFDEEINGLEQSWESRSLWLNPPYGRGLVKQFANKLVQEYRDGNIDEAIVLTNNTTDTTWFSGTLGSYASAFCFPDHRIQFIAPEGTEASSNSKGQVFSYFGDDEVRFVTEFQQYGLCVKPWRK